MGAELVLCVLLSLIVAIICVFSTTKEQGINNEAEFSYVWTFPFVQDQNELIDSCWIWHLLLFLICISLQYIGV